jgi:hypothetical protein
MPKAPIERRDNTLLNAILEIQKDTSEIKTSQAVAASKLIDVEDHLKTLNSKVATQEARQQELGSTQTLLTASLSAIQKKDEKPTFWERNQDKIIWGIVAIVLMLFYYLLTHNGFPDFIK